MSKPTDLLTIPVNPHFDLTVEPDENEFMYANPVTLNNHLLVVANTMVTLAEEEAESIRMKVRFRLERSKLLQQKQQLERDLLKTEPLTATEAKNLQTTAAAIARRAEDAGVTPEIEKLEEKLLTLEQEMEKREGLISRAQLYWKTADKLLDSLKTHLSFVKSERGK